MVALSRLVFALVLFLAGCGPTSSPSTAAPTNSPSDQETDSLQRESLLVRVDTGLSPFVQVGGEIILELDVTNVGPRDIQDLTIIVNDAYIAMMAVFETSPSAIRHNEQGGEYFTFGALAKGKTQRYVIRMSPKDPGTFIADVDVAGWSPSNMVPLPQDGGGVAEFTYGTDVAQK